MTDRRASASTVLAVVGFSVFVAADDLTVVSTMLRPIIGDLGLVLPDGLDDAAWIVNAYLIAFVAVMPISGRISDVLGRRRTFVGAYLLFLVGTILIPLSVELDEPFGWFLTGRVLTAIGGGAMVPIALAVVGDAYPPDRRARALGTLGAIETLGWVWGPLYGAMLVRFLSWQWQFWLNVPVALIGLGMSWWALREYDRPTHGARLDPIGAVLLTMTLVSLNVALLGSAEIQSVNGLEELTGSGPDYRFLYPIAAIAGATFVMQQRYSPAPLFDRRLFAGRGLLIALFVNFVVGAGLVIAMVDVPLFINSVELDLERAAVRSGWVLSALTAAMAACSYLGGRATERWWYQPPVLAGVAMATGAYAWMGSTWSADTSYGLFIVQLALLGAGFGLTVAPTTSAVVDAAPEDQRGSAAALVMVVRLLGLSVGLSALTAWGLARFNALRSDLDLPPITDPDFERALIEAQETLTAQAIAETFTAAAVVLGAGLLASLAMRKDDEATMDPDDPSGSPPQAAPDPQTVTTAEVPVVAGGTDDLRALVATMQRRLTVLVGTLAAVVAVGLIALLVTMNRAADGQAAADAARADAAAARADATQARSDLDAALAELATTQEDLARVEAGAALYASQITGFQELVTDLGPQVQGGIDEAIAGLRTFGDSTIEFTVNIDEVIPIDTEVVINRTVEVPINTSIPINETIDTTIQVDTFLGSLPLDITVPVDIVVPIDLVVDIPIDETVPISDEFPVQLDVPIAIDVGETELATLTDSLAAGLESLAGVLDGLGG